jgi:hypothetical protein
MTLDLLLVTIAKALVELAGLFIVGQGFLYALAGEKRESNLFYQIFKIVTRPVYRVVRAITPRVVDDRHVPWVALMILFWLWVLFTFLKIDLCAAREDRCLPAPEQAATARIAAGGDGFTPL